MDLNKEFVEQLEEIDKYTKNNSNNNLTTIVLKKIRQDFIDSYLTSMGSGICEHKNLIDEGYFNYQNNMFVEESTDKAKYHKYYCPKCKNEIIFENKEKILVKSK